MGQFKHPNVIQLTGVVTVSKYTGAFLGQSEFSGSFDESRLWDSGAHDSDFASREERGRKPETTTPKKKKTTAHSL